MSRLAGLGTLDAPPEILAGLRAIDPDADLIHLGGDEWLLGVQKENHPAKARIEEQLKTISHESVAVRDPADRARVFMEMAREVQLLQFYANGFRPIHLYECPAGPQADLVENFRLRDFNWRIRPAAAFRELADEVSFDVQDRKKRTNVVRDFMRLEGKSLCRHVFKRAKSFLQPGLPSWHLTPRQRADL